jgi:ABC-type bacteriocin/lantibiotic exporter with double-glycine peptidase domain
MTEEQGNDRHDKALERLGTHRRMRRIPFVQQQSASDCGAACLAMVLAYFGKSVRLDEVRESAGIGRDGGTADTLLAAGRWYGLRGRGVAVEMDELELLDPGTVLHWQFNHFVVFEKLRRDAVDIVDPAAGQRRIPLEEFRKAFTGVALLFEPGEMFEPEKAAARPLPALLGQILRRSGLWMRIAVTSVLVQIFTLALPVLTGVLVDRVIPRSDLHLLTVLGAGMAVMIVFQFLTTMVRGHLLLHMRTQLDARMTLDFLEHLLALPYGFFQRRATGDLIMRLNSNTVIREILTSSALSTLLDGALVVLYLGIIVVASRQLALLVVVLAILHLAVHYGTRGRVRALASEALGTQARSQSTQVEMLTGIETLKAMGAQDIAGEHWSGLFIDDLNVSLRRGALDATVDSVMSALKIASPLVILVWGGWAVMHNELSLGSMLGLNALALGFLTPLANFTVTLGRLQLLRSYLDRLDDVLSTPREQAATRTLHKGRLKGQISLERVSFRYSRATPVVVRDVSLEIQPGMFVALVGKSGSGKSTLASLLLGLYPPTSGRILYDGIDLHDIDFVALRKQLGIVTQRPYLFGTTIRNNISMRDYDVKLAEVMEASRKACVHDEIQAMPLGYETVLLDAGASLAGGQRQRIALARALVRKPSILLLDEATSALDAVTERMVQDQLEQLRCTRIVIAHRLSTIARAHLIVVLEDGAIVEQGTHEDLLAKREAYYRLIVAQLRGKPNEDEPTTVRGYR